MYRILVINPGSTSTKVAYFEDELERWNETIAYDKGQLSGFRRAVEQKEMRRLDIEEVLHAKELDLNSLTAVIGRGGPFKALESGTYTIDENLLQDIKLGNVQAEHISNIGALLADEFAKQAGVTAFFVDPVSVDEFEPIARVSGIPELERISLLHALNVRATAYMASKEIGRSY